MGLGATLRRRHYVWSWRARYWWMDTDAGARARVGAFACSLIVLIVQLVWMLIAAAIEPTPGEPAKSVYWWVVQLAIMVVSAIVSYALRPKPETPKPAAGDAPTIEDGKSAKDYFGTCWCDDQFILAWKIVGHDPIKSDGGKK